jgi:hypothetical protein
MADEIVHITWGRARCNPSGSGGAWVAECLCGWAKGGDFALSGEPGRAAAERLAEAFAVDHVDEAGEHAVNHPSNPDWQPPDNRLPRPVDRARPVSGSPFGPGAWDGLGPASTPVLPPLEHCPVCQEMMAPWSLPMHLREAHPVTDADA